MRPNYLLFSLMLLHAGICAQTVQWEKASETGSSTTITFALTWDNKILAAADSGLFVSPDSGRSWTQISSMATLCAAADSGGRLFLGNQNGIYRSTDEGTSWSLVQSTTQVFPDSSRLLVSVYGVIAFDDSIILAATANSGMYRSTDHGDSWILSNEGLTNHDVYCLTRGQSGVIYAGTKDGVYRSDDGGIHWVHRPPVRDFAYSALEERPGEVLAGVSYLVGESGVFRSTNSGDTWTKTGLQDFAVVGLSSNRRGNVAAAVSDGNLSVCGVYLADYPSALWTHVNGSLGLKEVRSVAFTQDGHLLVGTMSDGIYRTTDPIQTIGTSVLNETHSSTAYVLLTNYPNPFNPITRIRYFIPHGSLVSLQLYDTRGILVAEFDEGNKGAGENEIVFDGSQLPSGTYFCRLQFGQNSLTKRLLLLR